MELDPKEESHAWWKGTLKGSLKGLALGVGIGLCVALTLHIAVIPALTAFGFATAASALTFIITLTPRVVGATFNPFRIAMLSGLSGMFNHMTKDGHEAVNEYHQQKHNQLQQQDDAKLHQLEMREGALESQLHTTPSSLILAQGPRSTASFADAEMKRAQNAPTSPALH